MSVNYESVGGVGIAVDEKIKCKLVKANNGDDCCGDMLMLLDELGLSHREAGDSCYTGDEPRHYIVMKGKNLQEILEEKDKFISELYNYGIILSESEIKVIDDLLIT